MTQLSHQNDSAELTLSELVVRLRAFVLLAWRERHYSFRALAVTLPLATFVAFCGTDEYTASTKILPYRTTGATSALSGLAGLAGIRLPTGATDQTITANLFPEIARTIDFRVIVAETPIYFRADRETMSTASYFRERYAMSPVELVEKYTLRLPRTIQSQFKTQGENRGAMPDSALPSYSQAYLMILKDLQDRLAVTVDAATGVITIRGTMPDAYASADLVRAATERLMQRIIDLEARKAREQLAYVEDQLELSRVRFQRAQRDLAIFTDRNRGTLSASTQIELQHLQNQYNMAFEVFRQFSSEVEQARIKQSQDSPVFTVLEQVVVPNTRSSPRRGLLLAAGIFFGVVAGVGYTCWRLLNNEVAL